MKLEEIFSRLWEIYIQQNPSAKKVYDLFLSKGERVINDHIAFRTYNHPSINIDVLSEAFIRNGYKFVASYDFPDKHLNAKHFEHPEMPELPRIFISELITEKFSPELQSTVKQLVESIDFGEMNKVEMIFSGRLWGQASFETYNKLRNESEYAAWLYYNGFVANHFTVSVNFLINYPTMSSVNNLLKENGFTINSSGGEIKGTPEEFLEQSSIMADITTGEFIEGNYDITGCYYEFAKRYPDLNGNLYSGFIAKSADKIFESTNMKR